MKRGLIAWLLSGATLAAAQGFPERPIQMVVPFGPGGTTDIMARLLADEFGRQVGGSVVVINMAGAGGSIGMGNVARARADGYTVSMTTVGPLTIQLQLLRHAGSTGTHVPYRSTGDMIVPLKNGEIEAFNETPPVAVQHQLRPLVSLSDAPALGFESVPTAKQLGLPVRGTVWGGLVAPKGLPADVRNKLEAACQRATATTLYKARAQAANSPLVWRSGEDFKRFSLTEFESFKKQVALNGLQER